MREYQVYDNDIGYLKPGPFYNAENPSDVWNNATFVQFIDNAFEHFLNNNVDKLIIDVRNNPGGTNSFSDPLIAWYATEPFRFASEFLVRSSKHADESNRKRLESNPSGKDSLRLAKGYEQNPYGTLFTLDLTNVEPRQDKRFEGDVFVLVDRSSYSNAVSLAAITQDYGFGKVIGEATTDFATTFASMESFTLSETGIKVGFPKAHIIRPSGDKKAGPVIPDVLLKEPGLESALIFTSQTKPKATD